MRKRTNLDTAEANYIYAKVLIALNKTEKFANLSLPERNKVIDDISAKIIKKANDEEDAEAILFELKSYKMTDEERKKTLLPEVYTADLPKPKGFNRILKEKYEQIIAEEIERFANS
jgi:hypothetical protein